MLVEVLLAGNARGALLGEGRLRIDQADPLPRPPRARLRKPLQRLLLLAQAQLTAPQAEGQVGSAVIDLRRLLVSGDRAAQVARLLLLHPLVVGALPGCRFLLTECWAVRRAKGGAIF